MVTLGVSVVALAAGWLMGVPPDAAMGDGLRGPDAFSTQPRSTAALPRVCDDGETVPGIDVSKWQGSVDWEAVADDGIAFAFIRVSDGLTHRDAFFQENWAGARQAGIMAGAYQFFRPDQDPIAQANLVIEEMGTLDAMNLAPVIDVEDDGGMSPTEIQDAVQQWIDRVEDQTGVTPIIYTGAYFWQDHVGGERFAKNPLWIAHYTQDCPYTPEPWTRWDFHQYTDSGRVDGVSGNVDRNDFNGSIEDLGGMLGEPGECGNGVCELGEDSLSCREDCEPCGTVFAQEPLVIDESDECFDRFGDSEFWTTENDGYGDDAFTTGTTEHAAYNYGMWQLDFSRLGEYMLEVHIPADMATTTSATYQIRHMGELTEVTIDQSRADGWVELGTFEFDSGRNRQWVKLEDLTGEDAKTVVFDALRITPEEVYDPYEYDPRDDAEGQGGDLARGGAPQGCRVGGHPPLLGWLWLLALLGRREARRHCKHQTASPSRSGRPGPST